MKNSSSNSTFAFDQAQNLIVKAYQDYYPSILSYITFKTNSQFDAEDLAQDVFVRLLGYKQMLREETLKSFTYTIARNIVIDYIRRHTKKNEVNANLYEFMSEFVNDIDQKIHEKEILRLEKMQVDKFSPQRKLVYSLCRYEEMSVQEITDQLNISKRTVENHLFITRRHMREYLRNCI